MKVAILSDIHANIYALEAVLFDSKDENVDYYIVSGDLVGYYYWPELIVRSLMFDSRITCIRGNHENILEEGNKSKIAAEYYRRKYGTGYDVCRERLSEEEMGWLLKLPSFAELSVAGISFSIYHGSPSSIDEYIYPDATCKVLSDCCVGKEFTVLGHTHYPLLHRTNNGRTLLNPGSVGQPRDIGGLASYAIVDLKDLSVNFKRIPFDVKIIEIEAKKRDPHLPYLYNIMNRKLR
jgi:predicted phosphodiesterase